MTSRMTQLWQLVTTKAGSSEDALLLRSFVCAGKANTVREWEQEFFCVPSSW